MKSFYISIVIIFISSVIIFGCIFDNQKNSKNNEENKSFGDCKYEFRIKIFSNSSNYFLNVPLPVYSDNNRTIHLSAINEELSVINGNALFIIEELSFGPSLRINGSDNIVIGFSGKDIKKFLVNNKYKTLFLSMAKDKNNDGYYDDEYGNLQYYIYCHQNIYLNITINFTYHYENGPYILLTNYIDIQSKIKQDWNLINGTFEGFQV